MCRSLIFDAKPTGKYIFQPIFVNVNKPSNIVQFSTNEIPGL